MEEKPERKMTQVSEKKIVWEWSEDIKDASKLPVNNLYIEDKSGEVILNLKNILGHDEVCVALKKISDTEIEFITFNGLKGIFDVENMSLISKTMTK